MTHRVTSPPSGALPNTEIAVVIPAYKAKFIWEALESISAQQGTGFTVYVGDDASPEGLEAICQEFKGRIPLRYTRFGENLGGTSLVQQWNRCVELAREPWIWLFSDDDVMEPGCIAALQTALAETEGKFDLYRFNTSVIDANGELMRINPPHPRLETTAEYAYHRLNGCRMTFAPEHIFARHAFDRAGGFVEFPLAWGSDDASWIAFSEQTGFYTVEGPRVLWRESGMNVSGQGQSGTKLRAARQFVDWLLGRIAGLPSGGSGPSDEMLRAALHYWFRIRLRCTAPAVLLLHSHEIISTLQRVGGQGGAKSALQLVRCLCSSFADSLMALFRSRTQ